MVTALIVFSFALLVGTLGVVAGFALLLLIAPFFGKVAIDDPDDPNKISLFTKPEPGRSTAIMRGGRVDHIIHGKERGETIGQDETFKNRYLKMYDEYVFNVFGLRFIGIPGIHSVYSYDLPRSRKTEKDGVIIYTPVEKGPESGYRSNHVRTRLTPWFYQLKGVDIEGIPFTVKAAAYIYFNQDRVNDALFAVESWNTLLDQVLNSTVRGTLREHITLDDALGAISQHVWNEKDGNKTISETELQETILDSILSFKLKNGKTLAEAIGLVVERNDILDFAPEELTEEELVRLRSPALERRAAQARTMAGKGEAEYQKQVLDVLAQYPELAKINVDAEAFVKAAKAGSLDALAAGLLKKLTK